MASPLFVLGVFWSCSRPWRGAGVEFRRQDEDAAVVLLFSLVVSGQIRLRRIDGWRKIAAELSRHAVVEA